MRFSGLAVAGALFGVACGARCTNDRCLNVVKRAPSGSSDCQSLFRVTVTPTISTITHTITVVTTGTVTNTTTVTTTQTDAGGASKRWEDQREVRNILLRRTTRQTTRQAGPTASVAQKTPAYASRCASVAAYSSACSCMGVRHETITASRPLATKTVTAHSTALITKVVTIDTTQRVSATNSSAIFGNSTRTAFLNSTTAAHNTTISRSLSLSNLSVTSAASVSSDSPSTGTLTNPSNVPSMITSQSSLTMIGSGTRTLINTTEPARYANQTSGAISSNTTAHYLNSTSVQTTSLFPTSGTFQNKTSTLSIHNATSTGHYLNATSASISTNMTSVATRYQALNATSAPYLNGTAVSSLAVNGTTSAPYLNATSMPIANATKPLFVNATTTPFLNATSMPLANTTRPPFVNATSAPFLNATSVRFSNTSTPVSTPTPTTTLDTTCGETSTPFKLQVAQPEGLYDGWYLRISGNAIIFSSSANYSSQFSVESSGHLCAVGYLGENGNPAIGIVEVKDDLTGSAIYFVDGKRLTDLGPRGYGALDCAVDDDLECRARDMENWVACGLGLDISSDDGPTVVVDTWNCTSIGLSAVYE